MKRNKEITMGRYMFKQDNDCHWYLVPEEECLSFDDIINTDYESWTPAGEAWVDSFRIDGPHNMTFTDPKEIS